jgi:hypothetical protein
MSSPGKNILLALCAIAGLLVCLTLFQSKPNVSLPSAFASKTKVATANATKASRPSRALRSNLSEDNATIPPEEQARMHRMADNLLKPQMELDADAAAKVRGMWVDRFNKEKDPLLREEIITEMVQLDDALTLQTMLDLFQKEQHPGVREQIILIVGYLSSTTRDMAAVSSTMMGAYQQARSPEERSRILEVISNLPTKESVTFMQTAFASAGASAEDRFNAAEGLFKLAPRMAVDSELIRQVTERLKLDAQSGATQEERLMAARALAAPGQDNKAFLGQLLATESDPKMREFLLLASEQYPTR